MKISFLFLFAIFLCASTATVHKKTKSPIRRFHRRRRDTLGFSLPKLAPQFNQQKFGIFEWENGYKQEFLKDYLLWKNQYIHLKNMLFGYSGDVSAFVLTEALKKHIQGLADYWQTFNTKVQFKWQVEIVGLESSWHEISGIQVEALETVKGWNKDFTQWKTQWKNLNAFFSYQFKKDIEDFFIFFYEVPTATLEEKFMLLEDSLGSWESKWREHVDIWMDQWQSILEGLAQRIMNEIQNLVKKEETNKVADEILKQYKNEKIEQSDELATWEKNDDFDKAQVQENKASYFYGQDAATHELA